MNVRLYNDNIYPHTEKFKGDVIHIAPKAFVEMDEYEAVEFRGQMTSVKFDGGGNPLPECYKMIRIVKPENYHLHEIADKPICLACAKAFPTKHELDAHIRSNHVEQMNDSKEKEEIVKEELKKVRRG